MMRYNGFNAGMVDEQTLAPFPRSVVPEKRRRRTYWNAVFARAEVSSSYRPQRKLWVRERVGHYLPNDIAVRVAGENGQPDPYVSLVELLALDLLDADAVRKVRAATARSGPTAPAERPGAANLG